VNEDPHAANKRKRKTELNQTGSTAADPLPFKLVDPLAEAG
jgi:hypothetical protein